MIKLRVLRAAKMDIAASFHFYERQSKGLGIDFRESILSDIATLSHTAGIHSRLRGYFHMNGSRFRSIIYYLIEDDVATVYAVIDGRMNPAYHNKRLGLD